VLAGKPTLREPDGEHRLEPMDVAFFPPGPGGAHAVRNDTAETVRVLMWGENAVRGADARAVNIRRRKSTIPNCPR
jgi:uncharacterized cupin superfamily protein